MTLSLYPCTIPVFKKMLGNLSALLDKAAAHAEAKKFDPTVLLQARLYPDMFALTRQIQVAADFAKGTAARLAGMEPPKYEDIEKTIPELKARIDKTIAYLNTFSEAQFAGSEAREITLPFPPHQKMQGIDYLTLMALPNFYFHCTAAYAILRHNGVDIGKRDFIGAS